MSLCEITGFLPHHIHYYKLALLHRSLAQRSDNGRPVNNERLEFLGDAVLGAVVGDIVYRHFPGKTEGFLTSTRSKLVQRATLNQLANKMGITRLLQTGGKMNGTHNNYMAGNAFEALVGAIYLDRGYEACMHFVERRVLRGLVDLDKMAYQETNFKSKLLEWGQRNHVDVTFRLLSEKIDDSGSPVFLTRTVLNGVDGYDGRGFSKKESQQAAARLTLKKLKKSHHFSQLIRAATPAAMPAGHPAAT